MPLELVVVLVETFILDTTAFTEARLRKTLSASNEEDVIKVMVNLLMEARLKLQIRFYMTPSTWSELRRILIGSGVSLDLIRSLRTWISIKAPNKLSITIPASVFSEYVSDVRRRFFKGLRVAETAVRKAVRDCAEQGNNEECLGQAVKGLREKYREATRKGLVDSIEDLDTILLALELKAAVVSSDQGIRRLSEQLGIIVIDPDDFIYMLRKMVKAFELSEKRGENKGTLKSPEELAERRGEPP